MNWVSLATGLLKIVGMIAEYLNRKQLLDAGAKAALADGLLDLNRRMDIGLKIQHEHRTVDAALDELRRGGL
jgi:hypothetical protein